MAADLTQGHVREDVAAVMERYTERQRAEEASAAREVSRMVALVKTRMSPPGVLGLCPLLDARRIECGIPDSAFKMAAMFDRVMLYQIDPGDGEHYGDTGIVMPEVGKVREKEEAPHGIIVSAGLGALDILRSHGSGLGHHVMFVRSSPWRVPFERIGGHAFYLIPLRTGDLIADFDTGAALARGELTVGLPDLHHAYLRNGVEQGPAIQPYTRADGV